MLNGDDRIAHERGVAFLRSATAGMRVVIRHRLDDGSATDALGWLHVADTEHVVVATRRGLETVALDRVVAAKEVPPPPAPRERLRPT